MKKEKSSGAAFFAAGVLFILFIVFTGFLKFVDVQAIGPNGSSVGFAGLNGAVSDTVGVSMTWYKITKWLGYLAILVCLCFGAVGLIQAVRRKSVAKVDRGILLLGGFYVVVIGFYALFEVLEINFRPVLIDGELEASYPSSHTVLAICVFVSAMMILRRLLDGRDTLIRVSDGVFALLTTLTVCGRIVSGVHWITDIIGGVVLSVALLTLFHAFLVLTEGKKA